MSLDLKDPSGASLLADRTIHIENLRILKSLIVSAGTMGQKITRGTMTDGPPTDPDDGDIWIAKDVASGLIGAENAWVTWQFSYNEDYPEDHLWEFIGGAPISDEVLTNENSTNTAWADTATEGPLVVVPRDGNYEVSYGAYMYNNTAARYVYAGVSLNDADPEDLRAVAFFVEAGDSDVYTGARSFIWAGLSEGDELKVRYKVGSASTGRFAKRWIHVRPIRIT